ncbi:MAG TPA: hypothetical protein VF787_19315 [Thermoanaerobaculia bacterium]
MLELGLAGAKFEHGLRLDIGTRGMFVCGPMITHGEVRHSILLPARSGMVYHTGVAFTELSESQQVDLHQLLIDEAQEQVHEWEANLQGVAWRPKPAPRSVVKRRYICLRKTAEGWTRTTTLDPNQPLDGVAVPDDTPASELELLRRTYDAGDSTTRELMRRMAMVGILERLR